MKLRNRMFVLLAVFTLLPVCVLGMLSVHMTNSRVNEMARQNLEAVSTNQITNLHNFFQDRYTQMKTIGESGLIVEAVRYDLGMSSMVAGRSFVDDLLRTQTGADTYVATMSIVDRNYHVVASSEEYERDELSEMQDTGEQFRSGEFTIGSVYERETDEGNERMVSASCGIYSQEELIGYVVAEIETTYFEQLCKNTELLTDGTFYLIDGKGSVIVSGGVQADQTALIKTSADEEAGTWRLIGHDYTYKEKIYRRHFEGSDYLISYVAMDQCDWKVYLAENLDAQWDQNRIYAASAVCILLVLGLGMIRTQSFMSRRLMRPIDQIMQIFVQIRKNKDYSLRIPEQSTEELGALAYGINELLAYVEQQDRKEKERQKRLEHLAKCDPLTGISNKKAIEQKMRKMVQEAAQKKESLTVGFLDIDNFRDYNTNYGHQSGDSIIRFVAGIMEAELPGVVGRNGGDEFVFCCDAGVSKTKVREALERMLRRLNAEYVGEDGVHVPVPCSIGVVIADGARYDYEELIRRADKAMYESKANGKNQFYISEEQK